MKSLCMICPIFIALLVGCGAPMGNPQPPSPDMSTPGGISNPPPPTPDKDGSRIRVVRQRSTTSDGLQVTHNFYTYFDKQLDTTCWPSADSSGRTRCFPTPASQTGAFADSKCTVQAVTFTPSCGARKYAVEYIPNESNSCFPARYRLWRVGAQVPKIYVGSPGSCGEATPPTGLLVFAVSTPVPDEDMALLTTTTY